MTNSICDVSHSIRPMLEQLRPSKPPSERRATGRLRLAFVRALLTPLEQAFGPALYARLRAGSPDRLHEWLDTERLRSSGPMGAIELDLAEDLLRALEDALGDGSGRLLEAAAFDLFCHALAEQQVDPNETLIATLARLRPGFGRFFFGVVPVFEVRRLANGLGFVVALQGRPGLAEPLRRLALGAVRAAQRANAHGTGLSTELSLRSGVHGDCAWIRADTPRHVVAPTGDGSRTTRPELRETKTYMERAS